MLCDKCQQRDAKLHLSKIVNNHKTEMYLCEACAAEEGINNYGFYTNPFDSMLANFFNDSYGSPGLAAGKKPYRQNNRQCPQCGMTEAVLLQNGKLGCSECYKVFEDRIDPLLRRIHGNNKHCGKIPGRKNSVKTAEAASRPKVADNKAVQPSDQQDKSELAILKEKMQQAIATENFEQAAIVRDQIKELEQKEKGVQS